MMNRLVSMLPALACALLVQAVHAQSPSQPQAQSRPQAQSKAQPQAKPQPEAQGGFLYKSTMPDGKVMYGDAPMPGAVKVEKTRPDTSKKGITAATPKEREALRRMEAERASAGAASAGRTQAYTAADWDAKLKELEADREKAKEPLPGERIGTAGGASRLTEGYWERQKRLDARLEAIRKEAEKARSASR